MRQAQAGIMTHIAVFKRTIEVDGVKKTKQLSMSLFWKAMTSKMQIWSCAS